MMRSLAAATCAALVATACAGGLPVHIPAAPAATEPLEERTAYYQAYRPVDAARITMIGVQGGSQRPMRETGWLRLANGKYVALVEDLRPAINASSPTAHSIEESLAARASMFTWSLVSAGLVAGSFAAGGTGFWLYFVSDNEEAGVVGMVTGLALFLGAGGTGWLANLYNFHETDTREQAYGTYDASLRERLGLPPADDTSANVGQ